MIKFIRNCAKLKGLSHLKSGRPCQDSTLTMHKNGVDIIICSDGCGSSHFSEYGSEIVVNLICGMFTNSFDYFYQMDELNIKKHIVNRIIDEYKKFYIKNSSKFDEYINRNRSNYHRFLEGWEGYDLAKSVYPLTLLNATLVFVAIKNGQAIIGRLGDGFVAEVIDKKLNIVSTEIKFGLENATNYATSVLLSASKYGDESYGIFTLFKRDDISNIDMFVCASDGVAYSMVSKDENKTWLDYRFFEQLLKKTDYDDFLLNDVQKVPGCDDDLSIASIRRNRVVIKGVNVREFNPETKTISISSTVRLPEKIVSDMECIKVEENSYVDSNINILTEEEASKIHKMVGTNDFKAINLIDKISRIRILLKDHPRISFENVIVELGIADICDLEVICSYAQTLELLNVDEENGYFNR